MRVGLLYGLGPSCSYDDAFLQIAEADRLGLDSALFEEHHGDWGAPAVFPLITAAAGRTRSIHLGCANRQVVLEHPVNSAEDAVVADIASRGRLIFGASAGERAAEFAVRGLPWDERESRFREAIDLIRTVWGQSSVQYVGEHYRFPLLADGGSGWRREPVPENFVVQWRRGQVLPKYLSLLPRPVQLPYPPIWVGATSRAMVEWAASKGLSLFVPSLLTEAEVGETVSWYDTALSRAGRERNEVDVVVAREVFLGADGEATRRLGLPQLRAFAEAARHEQRNDLAGRAAQRGLDDETLLASVALYGTVGELTRRFLTLKADIGATHIVSRCYLPGRHHLDVLASIQLLASGIAPRLVA